jgi:hypothetical protein
VGQQREVLGDPEQRTGIDFMNLHFGRKLLGQSFYPQFSEIVLSSNFRNSFILKVQSNLILKFQSNFILKIRTNLLPYIITDKSSFDYYGQYSWLIKYYKKVILLNLNFT